MRAPESQCRQCRPFDSFGMQAALGSPIRWSARGRSFSARHGGSAMSSAIGFTRLADGFRVVRYDRPGTGLSDRDVRPRTQAAEVLLLAMLADALGDAQFSLFAVSCAGPVALTYAATHQDRVRRLCLYGSYASGADVATPKLRDALANLVPHTWKPRRRDRTGWLGM
jgi:pimeloyl-ACP methyl ester carboxylesterase